MLYNLYNFCVLYDLSIILVYILKLFVFYDNFLMRLEVKKFIIRIQYELFDLKLEIFVGVRCIIFVMMIKFF